MGVVAQFKTHMARRRADELMKTTLLARAPFMIETKHGAVAIDPIECVWATTVKATDRADDSKAVLEWVPIGGQIAACGKLVSRQTPAGERALHLTSDGTRAPILLATSAKGHPFALASHIVRQRRITLVGLLAAAAIIGTLAPMMPSP
ncbi:MAG: hypothetical protein JWO36_4825, partial [Myxococcales bacterium]|nr:hypothetical protein [Myxococcales bacterium]